MVDVIYRFDPESCESLAPPATALEARQRLEEGNNRFTRLLGILKADAPVESMIIPFDLTELRSEGGPAAPVKQAPFAAVLGCSDARVPTELVFGQAYNDMFVVRVAGNVLGSECLGSIDYAVEHLGNSLKLLVVLGHTGCGAVTASVDAFLLPGSYLSLATSHALRLVMDRIAIAVRAAARTLEVTYGRDVSDRPGYRTALIEISVVVHAALTAYTLEAEFKKRSDCGVVYGTIDLVTHRVGLPIDPTDAPGATLHTPPRDRQAFIDMLTELATSSAVVRMLAG